MKYQEFVFWILIFLIISLGIYAVHWIRSESFSCVSNPYNYTMTLLEKGNLGEVSCSCIVNKGWQSIHFDWDINGFSFPDSGSEQNFSMNISIS